VLFKIDRIKRVHEERIIHRDIKPDNFLVGSKSNTVNTVYIIDFGLAKCYKNAEGEHIAFREGKNLTGTARYASINTHLGYEQSRRDDLETIAHVLLYFLRGSLPWQGLPGRSKNEKYKNIMRKKREVTIDELCINQPPEFAQFLTYIRELAFAAEPDYKFMTSLFEGCMERHSIKINEPDFIWNKNRLFHERQALKDSMMRAIGGKSKNKKDEEGGAAGAGNDRA
jgi:serine/threonine protein kinase